MSDSSDNEEKEEESPEEVARQTEEKAVRREQRSKQRSILDIILDEKSSLEDINKGRFEQLRQENNEVFQNICHGREGIQDAIIVNHQVKIVKELVSKLDDISRRFDFDSFSTALKEKFTDKSSGHFSWSLLGTS
jgi:hypothetical protein